LPGLEEEMGKAAMKLSRLDIRLLRFIGTQYPVAFVSSGKIVAMDERPLPTEAHLLSHCRKFHPADVKNSVDRLVSYQYIAPVTLHARSDFVEAPAYPGHSIRLPIAKSQGDGVIGYQIRMEGKERIEGLKRNRIIRWLIGIAGSVIVIVVTAVATAIAEKYFGGNGK
jgi:hypothetical protein